MTERGLSRPKDGSPRWWTRGLLHVAQDCEQLDPAKGEEPWSAGASSHSFHAWFLYIAGVLRPLPLPRLPCQGPTHHWARQVGALRGQCLQNRRGIVRAPAEKVTDWRARRHSRTGLVSEKLWG